MKAITIKQPWASLIVDGIKDIENRTWKTKFRGRVLIHAGNSWFNFNKELPIGFEYHIEIQDAILKHSEDPDYYPCGAIIGSVDIVDCVINHQSIWAEKTECVLVGNKFYTKEGVKPTWNWVLANAKIYDEPILNVKGKQSFWEFKS